MFEKLSAFLRVLRVGNEVADPDKWMKFQANGNKVGLLILALVGLAKAYGYAFPIDDNQALILGGAIVSIWNIVFGAATSYRQGLLPAKPSTDGGSGVSSQVSTEVQSEVSTTEPVQPVSDVDIKESIDKNIYNG